MEGISAVVAVEEMHQPSEREVNRFEVKSRLNVQSSSQNVNNAEQLEVWKDIFTSFEIHPTNIIRRNIQHYIINPSVGRTDENTKLLEAGFLST